MGGEGEVRLGEPHSSKEELRKLSTNSLQKGGMEIAIHTQQLGPSWYPQVNLPNLSVTTCSTKFHLQVF